MTGPAVLTSGPWSGVLDTTDPLDDQPDKLVNATNGYLVDPNAANGFYSRAGFTQNPGPGANDGARTQLYAFAQADGTYLHFMAIRGKLYRCSGTNFVTQTDVTPVGVTLAADDGTGTNVTTRYYMTQLAGQLVFTDGVNRPWLGTNLTGTPITGTYIDADGAGGTFTVQGKPTLYQGSLVMIVGSIGTAVMNAQAGVGFIWCEPNRPSVGYCQTNYADFFNYVQTGSQPLTAIWGTNEGLYIFREASIGLATGPLPQLQSSPTTATVAVNVGTLAPDCMAQFGTNLFFVDRVGRPYLMNVATAYAIELGFSGPVPIWMQLRGQFDRHPSYLSYPNVVALVGIAVVEPQRNLVLMAPYSSGPTGGSGSQTPLSPTFAFVFDGGSGRYMGTWTLADGTPTWNAVAVWHDTANNPVVAILQDTLATVYRVWTQALLSAAQWNDVTGGSTTVAFLPSVETGRLGYAAATVLTSKRATAVTMSGAPTSFTVLTPYNNSTVEGTPSPSSSYDSTYRLVCGLDVRAARGVQVTLTATGALSAQWGVQRVEVAATTAAARAVDA